MSAFDLAPLLDELADAIATRVVERLKQAQPPAPPPADDLAEIVDTKTAASYLGLAPQTLKARRLRGCGPAFVKIGASVRYPRDGLKEFRAKRLRRNTSEATP